MFRVEEKDKQTYIEIDGLKNLRLCDITIESNSMFKRIASTPQGVSKEIYNLSLNDISYTDTTIPLDWNRSRDDIYTVRIANNDDKPIKIDGITVRFYVDEIVFEGNKGLTYTLEFGEDAIKTAPVYDIARYKEEILKESIDIARLGEIIFEEAAEVPPEQDYRWMFNVVVLMVALLLGGVIVRRLKQKG